MGFDGSKTLQYGMKKILFSKIFFIVCATRPECREASETAVYFPVLLTLL